MTRSSVHMVPSSMCNHRLAVHVRWQQLLTQQLPTATQGDGESLIAQNTVLTLTEVLTGGAWRRLLLRTTGDTWRNGPACRPDKRSSSSNQHCVSLRATPLSRLPKQLCQQNAGVLAASRRLLPADQVFSGHSSQVGFPNPVRRTSTCWQRRQHTSLCELPDPQPTSLCSSVAAARKISLRCH
jgi:hypothetical protein